MLKIFYHLLNSVQISLFIYFSFLYIICMTIPCYIANSYIHQTAAACEIKIKLSNYEKLVYIRIGGTEYYKNLIFDILNTWP